MIDVRRAADRYAGGEPEAGVDTRHAFSFSGFYDPANIRFGLLVACNEERLAPGAGFAEHTHRDTEIVTWVIEGELEHRDGEGRVARLRAGDAQWLSAGSGVRHVERNVGGSTLRFLQMWLHPEVFGARPDYAAVTAPVPPGPGLTLLASGAPDATPPLRLRQGAAALWAGRPLGPEHLTLPPGAFCYLHVLRGTVRLDGSALHPGDAARATGEPALSLHAAGGAEYLFWSMRSEPAFS
ncbi:pirin family protein [Actinacidiphila paucisporea]|uniref:pirin family protein n=1 Tax=Actinacidiphila paucisporea TaxID=310782 RepID=UPI00093733A9|nr:pirin family protein [Actinacidiphila paucisporea]